MKRSSRLIVCTVQHSHRCMHSMEVLLVETTLKLAGVNVSAAVTNTIATITHRYHPSCPQREQSTSSTHVLFLSTPNSARDRTVRVMHMLALMCVCGCSCAFPIMRSSCCPAIELRQLRGHHTCAHVSIYTRKQMQTEHAVQYSVRQTKQWRSVHSTTQPCALQQTKQNNTNAGRRMLHIESRS